MVSLTSIKRKILAKGKLKSVNDLKEIMNLIQEYGDECETYGREDKNYLGSERK